jgi:hypothetical protein
MERTPVDGVMCVVWLSRVGTGFVDKSPVRIGYWSDVCGFWLLGKDQCTGNFVTHWTTLDEAKAAPDMALELNLLRTLKACKDLGMGDNLVMIEGPNP